jgi:hypothetical protein
VGTGAFARPAKRTSATNAGQANFEPALL